MSRNSVSLSIGNFGSPGRRDLFQDVIGEAEGPEAFFPGDLAGPPSFPPALPAAFPPLRRALDVDDRLKSEGEPFGELCGS